MRRPVAVLVTGLLLALLGGCYGEPVAESTFPAAPLTVYPLADLTEPEITALCPAEAARHFEGFTSYERVYICRADEHRPSDGTTTYGPWQVAYRVVDPRELLARYAEPDDTRIVTGDCPDGVADPLIVWVHSAGAVQPVYAPVNGCGFARGEMVDAYQSAERDLVTEVDTGRPLDERDTPAEH